MILCRHILRDVMSAVTNPHQREENFERLKRRRDETSLDLPADPGPSPFVLTPVEASSHPSNFLCHPFGPDMVGQYSSPVPMAAPFDPSLPTHGHNPTAFSIGSGFESHVVSPPSAVGEGSWLPPDQHTYAGDGGFSGGDPSQDEFNLELEAIFTNLFPEVLYGASPDTQLQTGQETYNTPFWGDG